VAGGKDARRENTNGFKGRGDKNGKRTSERKVCRLPVIGSCSEQWQGNRKSGKAGFQAKGG